MNEKKVVDLNYPGMSAPSIVVKAQNVVQKGITQQISIITTVDGKQVDMQSIGVRMVHPDGKIEKISVEHVFTGDYRIEIRPMSTGSYHIITEVRNKEGISSKTSFHIQSQMLPPSFQSSQKQQPVSRQEPLRENFPANLPTIDNWDPKIWVNREIYGYNITRSLEPGGTSYVLAGTNDISKRAVAIKVPMLHSSKMMEVTTLQETLSEAGKLEQLSRKSPYIVQLLGTHVDMVSIENIINTKDSALYLKNPPAIIMEYMGGGDAKALLMNDTLTYSSKWSEIVLQILLRISKALQTIHNEGFVHLDLKPGNILFNESPPKTGSEMVEHLKQERLIPKLSDLGSAVKIGGKFNQFTPEYSSAQQIMAWTGIGVASKDMDVYSLGATIYMMMTKMSLNSDALIGTMNSLFEKQANYFTKKESQLFKEERDKAIEVLRQTWSNFHPDLSYIEDENIRSLIQTMVEKDPGKRPQINHIIDVVQSLVT